MEQPNSLFRCALQRLSTLMMPPWLLDEHASHGYAFAMVSAFYTFGLSRVVCRCLTRFPTPRCTIGEVASVFGPHSDIPVNVFLSYKKQEGQVPLMGSPESMRASSLLEKKTEEMRPGLRHLLSVQRPPDTRCLRTIAQHSTGRVVAWYQNSSRSATL